MLMWADARTRHRQTVWAPGIPAERPLTYRPLLAAVRRSSVWSVVQSPLASQR